RRWRRRRFRRKGSGFGQDRLDEPVGLFDAPRKVVERTGSRLRSAEHARLLGRERRLRHVPGADPPCRSLERVHRLSPGLFVAGPLQPFEVDRRLAPEQFEHLQLQCAVAHRVVGQMHQVDRPPVVRARRAGFRRRPCRELSAIRHLGIRLSRVVPLSRTNVADGRYQQVKIAPRRGTDMAAAALRQAALAILTKTAVRQRDGRLFVYYAAEIEYAPDNSPRERGGRQTTARSPSGTHTTASPSLTGL